MANDDDRDVEVLREYRICSACIGEEYLSAEVERDGENAECSYCEEEAKTISMEELAGHIERAFKRHYQRTAIEPEGIEYLMAKDGLWERHGERSADSIADAAQLDEEPAEHVRQILYERHYDIEDARAGEEGEFDEEAHYEEVPVQDYELQAEWQHFQNSLQTQSRLFNRQAEATLDSIFENLEGHRTHDGRPAIVNAGPEREISALYRARVFQSNNKLEKALARPDFELGPPPPRYAIAGRMNARGNGVFYGATDLDVALAETRPPVGSRVAVARFEIIRPLRLVDIDVLRAVYVEGSIFDSSYLGRLEKAKFLRTVSHRIAAPVMPDDEPFDYLVTQAIADYLAGRNEPSIDGIIYPSVQDGGNKKNVVLFHKAARVESFDIPPGTEISTYLFQHDEDGASPDYSVHEEVPPAKVVTRKPDEDGLLEQFLGMTSSEDTRQITLSINLNSVTVHHVENVTYGKTIFEVRRHRSQKRETEF